MTTTKTNRQDALLDNMANLIGILYLGLLKGTLGKIIIIMTLDITSITQ